ncbi:hypothetical protein [Streptomyces sp. NPDC102437]|uniref:hypothetical protein n=1 Tax=Streptomyces sp. NPDC102437 TaxID=3366175 RepID=UPI0037F7FC12
MTDSLHTRYMAASDTWHAHRKGCPPCESGQHCPTGDPLYKRFTNLQDAYLRHLRTRVETR